MNLEELNKKQWWIALCPSGKILEIVEGVSGGRAKPMMLPPHSNQDMPEWVSVVPEAQQALSELKEL